MSDILSGFLLTQVINYGAPLFGLTLFLGAMGIPLPASLMVIAVGSFSQQGYFSALPMAWVGLLSAVLGDAISFSMGNYGKDWVQKKISESAAWNNAQVTFQRSAGPAIFLTRFLITALAVPTNLIAGGSGYKFRRFMTYDLLGEAVWILLYGGLGYAFGSQWEAVSDFINSFGTLILGIVILGAGVWLAWNWQEKSAQAKTDSIHSE
jgi:membrane protein DedA with SNARE-associated domain